MAILGVDDFKSKLRGGGARANLFRCTINFPAYAGGDAELTSFLCKAAQLPQSSVSQFSVPFRGRELKVAGERTFDNWSVTIINDTDFAHNTVQRISLITWQFNRNKRTSLNMFYKFVKNNWGFNYIERTIL